MASTLSRLQIVLNADTANYSRQMRAAQTTAQRFGSIAKKSIGAAAKGIAAGAAIAATAVSALASEQMNAAKEIDNLARIAGSTTTQFQKDAAAASRYGIEMEQLGDISKDTKEKIGEFVTSGGGGLQDFADAVGYSEKQTKAFAESMQGLSGVEVLKTMVKEMEAAGASTEQISFALEGMGSDATNLIPLLVDGGKGFKELGDQAQAAGAIMSSDTIAATKQLSNNLGQMKQQWTGVKNTIFEAVLPALTSASEWLVNNKVQIKAFTDKAMELGTALAGHVVTGFNMLKDAFVTAQPYLTLFKDGIITVIDFVSTHQEIFIALGTGIGVAAAAFATGQLALAAWGAVAATATAATAAFGTALAIVTSPVTLVVAAIAGLVAAGVYLYRNWDEVKAKADEVWMAIGGTVAGMVDTVTGAWGNLKAATSAAWDGIKNKITGAADSAKAAALGKFNALKSSAVSIFNSLPGPVKSALGAIANVVRTQINIVKTVFKTGFAVVKGIVTGDTAAVKAAIRNGLSQLAGIARNQLGRMVAAFKSIGGKMTQIGRDVIQGLVNGIKAKAGEAVAAAQNIASSVYNTVKSKLKIFSPSRVMRALGHDTADGFVLGITDKKSDAFKAAQSLVNSTLQGISDTRKKIALFGNDSIVAAFDYDVADGIYKDVSKDLTAAYRAELVELENIIAIDKARKKITDDLAASQKKRAAATKQVEKTIEGMNRQLYQLGGERNAVDLLNWDLEHTKKYAKAGADAIADLKAKTKELQQAQANAGIEKSIESINRQLALMDDNSAMASLWYDLTQTDKYANASTESIDKFLKKTLQLHNAEETRRIANEIAENKKRTLDAFNNLGVNQPQTEFERLRESYVKKMAIVEEFEQAHTDKKEQAAKARQTIEQQYQQSSNKMMLSTMEQGFGNAATLMKDAVGEQSGIYKAMFAAEKAIAIARSIMAIQTGIAQAAAIPFPMNLGAIANVIAATSSIVTTIKGIQQPNMPGFMTGGYTGDLPTNQTAGLVHGREFVANAPTTRKYRPELEAMHDGTYERKANVNVTIENHTGAAVQQKTDSNGDIRVIVGQELERQLPAHVSNPHSAFNKSLKNNYQLKRSVG